ncbi:hypothetical protein [Neisseria leonii]|uniref:hypothetical protein n=1 Tax=Neisseria leonii TaxID=2995413 RepID=UPI00237BF9DE|nr:hypothetical protein [Neisseria sp. 3986]MDD9325653.1 hypothetical protein [Neisseria sp. 3986]
MKYFKKTWQADYQGMSIVVQNEWNLSRCREEVRINGRLVHHLDTPLDRAGLGRRLDFQESGIHIGIKLGSAWHMCGAACQILINGRYYAGNRIVLFVPKKQN